MSDDVIPLPDILNTCDCLGRPTRHSTHCQVARDFDAIPLRERPGYKLGQRFEAISWVYPHKVRGRVNVEIDLDLLEVILAHLDEYRSFEVPDGEGWHDWEKPLAFMLQFVEDRIDVGVFAGDRRVLHDRSYLDELELYPWTEEDFVNLNARIARLPTPGGTR